MQERMYKMNRAEREQEKQDGISRRSLLKAGLIACGGTVMLSGNAFGNSEDLTRLRAYFGRDT